MTTTAKSSPGSTTKTDAAALRETLDSARARPLGSLQLNERAVLFTFEAT